MPPSDSPTPSALAPVPLASSLPRRRVLVLDRPRLHPRTRGALEHGNRRSISPVALRGDSGPPRLLGRPLRACPGRTPRRADRRLAPSRRPSCCLRSLTAASAPGMSVLSRPHSRGPRARVPTHRRIRCRLRRKARYPPVGLNFGGVGFAPTGRRTIFQEETSPPSIPMDQHCLVASVNGHLGPRLIARQSSRGDHPPSR